MIRKIGVICQDAISRGFLEGLCKRLGCAAEFVDPPAVTGKTRDLPRRLAVQLWRHFRKHGVDLVVRFTDADGNRWQQVQRDEIGRVPSDASSVWLCGVAVNCVEDWLAGDADYVVRNLGLLKAEVTNPHNRVGAIKAAFARTTSGSVSGASRTFVAEAPRTCSAVG